MVPLSRWCSCQPCSGGGDCPGTASDVRGGSRHPGQATASRGTVLYRFGQRVWCDAGVRSLLSEEVRQRLTSLGRKRTYDTGERLITEGDSDTHVIVLVDGRVKVTFSEEDGTEVLLSIRGAGDVVGERAAIDQDVRSATVTALRPCSTRVLSANDFFAFVEAHHLARPLLRLGVARQREGQLIRVELSTLPVSRRLVRTLLRLGD